MGRSSSAMRVLLLCLVALAAVGRAEDTEEEVLPPDPPLVWYPDHLEAPPKPAIRSAIDDLMDANEANRLPSLIPDKTPDLGEGADVEDMGPDTHEAIDMVLAANDMEVHVDDFAKQKREKELGEARKAAEAKSRKCTWISCLLWNLFGKISEARSMRCWQQIWQTLHECVGALGAVKLH